MKHPGRLYTLSLLICLSLCSCFEYIEEITYTNDQSGKITLTLNCNRSKSKLDALMKLDTFMGYRIPNTQVIEGEILTALSALNNTKGISHVNISRNYTDYIFVLTANFDSTHHLNEALNNVSRAIGRKNDLPEYDLFTHSNHRFERLMVSNDSLIESSNIRKRAGMFDGATATAIYRFPRAVKAVSNQRAMVSKSGKAVMLKTDIKDLIKKPNLFANSITLQ